MNGNRNNPKRGPVTKPITYTCTRNNKNVNASTPRCHCVFVRKIDRSIDHASRTRSSALVGRRIRICPGPRNWPVRRTASRGVLATLTRAPLRAERPRGRAKRSERGASAERALRSAGRWGYFSLFFRMNRPQDVLKSWGVCLQQPRGPLLTLFPIAMGFRTPLHGESERPLVG